jgi:hypothetical protein
MLIQAVIREHDPSFGQAPNCDCAVHCISRPAQQNIILAEVNSMAFHLAALSSSSMITLATSNFKEPHISPGMRNVEMRVGFPLNVPAQRALSINTYLLTRLHFLPLALAASMSL